MFDNENDLDPMEGHNRVRQLPIYLKAEEIAKLIRHIVKSIENTDIKFKRRAEKAMLDQSMEYLMDNAMIIPAKIAGAEVVDFYDLKMENAAIIRKAARELISDSRCLQMHGCRDFEYLDLLRKEVDEFRILFAEWVKTFDPYDYIIDRWGLFNPPGVNYDDHDPDDDLPFDAISFQEELFSSFDTEDYEKDEEEDEEEDEDEDEDDYDSEE